MEPMRQVVVVSESNVLNAIRITKLTATPCDAIAT